MVKVKLSPQDSGVEHLPAMLRTRLQRCSSFGQVTLQAGLAREFFHLFAVKKVMGKQRLLREYTRKDEQGDGQCSIDNWWSGGYSEAFFD